MDKKKLLLVSYSKLSRELDDFIKIVNDLGDKEAELYAKKCVIYSRVAFNRSKFCESNSDQKSNKKNTQ